MSAGDLTQDQSVQAEPSVPALREMIAMFCIATATIGFAPVLHLANPALIDRPLQRAEVTIAGRCVRIR